MVTVNLSTPSTTLRIRTSNKSEKEEVILIELQGTIETGGQTKVGELEWEDGCEVPKLIVGTHELVGKVVKLNPPLAFLYRKQPKLEEGETTDYEVRAIVTRKLQFTKRPTILVEGERV